MPPQNLSTPTPQEQQHDQQQQQQQHHQQQQLLHQQQHQHQHQQQHMSQSLVEQPHGISAGAGGGPGAAGMSDQIHGGSHGSLEHAHSMAEHAAHSMLDLSETGNSLEHLAGGGGHTTGHRGGHTPQSLADLSHRRPDHGLDSSARREGLPGRGMSGDGAGPGAGGRGGGNGGSLTPTLHQMSQQGDGRSSDMAALGGAGGAGSNSGSGAGLLARPMSGLGGVVPERQGLSQPMRNLTPVGGVDGRGDSGRGSVGLPGSNGGHSMQEGGRGGTPSSLNFSPDSQHHMPPQQRIPIIPKRGRPPGSGSSQHSLAKLHHHHLGPNALSSSSSSSSSLHGGHHHHSSHNLNANQTLHMRSLSEHQHQNSHHHGSDNSNGRASTGGVYGLDSSGGGGAGGQQLNSRPGSVALMSEPSDSRTDLRPNYSTSERKLFTSTAQSSSLIEETIAAVASNLNRSSPNGGIMPGPVPPNSHPQSSSSSLMAGGLGGLLPRSNSTLGPGAGGDDSLADLVGRGHSHGIPMLSERASQSLSGLIDDDKEGHHGQHHHHHHGMHHPGSSSGGGGGQREIEKTHPCLICLKMFRSKQQLAQHSLVHTGIRKHICTFCDRAFKQLSHLQQHVRIHTGERKYMCKFCDRGFKQLSHLQKHISVHTEAMDSSLAQDAGGSSAKGNRGRPKGSKKQKLGEDPHLPDVGLVAGPLGSSRGEGSSRLP